MRPQYCCNTNEKSRAATLAPAVNEPLAGNGKTLPEWWNFLAFQPARHINHVLLLTSNSLLGQEQAIKCKYAVVAASTTDNSRVSFGEQAWGWKASCQRFVYACSDGEVHAAGGGLRNTFIDQNGGNTYCVERADALGFGHQIKFVVDVLQPDTSTCRLCKKHQKAVDDDDSDEAMSVLSSDDDGFMPWAKTIHVRRRLLQELPVASGLWWLKRTARRRTLLRLAEECAAYGPQLRRRCAELRAAAAKRRLELLRTGQMKEYAAMVQETKDQRLQEVLDETKRILAELGVSSSEEKDFTEICLEQIVLFSMFSLPVPLGERLMPHQANGLRWLVRPGPRPKGLLNRNNEISTVALTV
ncbi:unnamed protein product [Cladocopium goreaui]|uniref:Uncharacterized protein n=1 Tax=Cladocopium goreaui TaxID=2562237 RepID=A0A9P1D2C5_9DINO|nr:unnamed protein product [Cladocopium goreaui]